MKIPWLKFDAKYAWIGWLIVVSGTTVSVITDSVFPLLLSLLSPLILLLLLPLKYKIEDRFENNEIRNKLHQHNLNLQELVKSNIGIIEPDLELSEKNKPHQSYELITNKDYKIRTSYYRGANFILIKLSEESNIDDLSFLGKDLKVRLHRELRDKQSESSKSKKTPVFVSIGVENKANPKIYREDASYYNFDVMKELIGNTYKNPSFSFADYDNRDFSVLRKPKPKLTNIKPKRDFLQEARDKMNSDN